MSRWTTVVLLVLALAVSAWIFFVERHHEPADESGPLVRLQPTAVSEIEIVHDETLRMVPSGRDWTMLSPVRTRVPADHVRPMLATLSALRPVREVTPAPGDDLGLSAPRLTARVRTDDREIGLRFGADDPAGGGVYLAVDGRDGAVVVARRLFDLMARSAQHYRPRELVGVNPYQVEAVRYSGPDATRHFRKVGDRWRIVEPIEDAADSSRVRHVVDYLIKLRAEEFADDAPASLEPYGLDAPTERVKVTHRGRGQDTELYEVEVLFGSTVDGDPERRYAKRASEPFVYVVGTLALRELQGELARFRDRIAVHGRARDLRSLRFGELTLTRDDDEAPSSDAEGVGPAFRLTEPVESAAHGPAVDALVSALVGWEVEEFLPAGATIDRPLSVEVTTARGTDALLVGRRDAAGTFVWGRAGSDWRMRSRGDLPALLVRGPLAYRSLEVNRLGLGTVREIRLEGSVAAHYTLAVDEDRWTRGETAVPTFKVHLYLVPLVELVAARWVGPRSAWDDATTGLGAPYLTVELTLEDGETSRLTVGAPTDGGRYASLSDESAVFVLAEADVERLGRLPERIEAPEVPSVGFDEMKDASVAELVGALEHVDHVRRRRAAYEIWRRDERSLGPRLLPLLRDPDPGVRIQAAVGLRKLGVERAIPELIELLRDTGYDPPLKPKPAHAKEVRSYALIGLKELTGQTFGFEPERWRSWWESSRSGADDGD